MEIGNRLELSVSKSMRKSELQRKIIEYMVLFTNPSAQAGYDTRSIFKRSLTGFEFRVFLLLD